MSKIHELMVEFRQIWIPVEAGLIAVKIEAVDPELDVLVDEAQVLKHELFCAGVDLGLFGIVPQVGAIDVVLP